MKKHAIIFFSIIVLIVASFMLLMFFLVLFPTKYKNLVIKYAQEFNLSPSLVFSVINVESGFDKNAISNVGAVGLMQLMPETANEVALKLGEKFDKNNLFNPETNIKYGCFYLRYLMDMFANNYVNAVASYNAGFNKVISWLNNSDYSNKGELKKIPIYETEKYVLKIKTNLKVYSVIAKN